MNNEQPQQVARPGDALVRRDATSDRDFLREFTAKQGVGACICEGQEISAAINEVKNLRAVLESILQYGSDTLSGRTDGPDDRAWQREAVLEMTKRARIGLDA